MQLKLLEKIHLLEELNLSLMVEELENLKQIKEVEVEVEVKVLLVMMV